MAGPHTSPRGRGLTRRADRYAVAQLLCDQERAIGRKSGTLEHWGAAPESGAECYNMDETRCWSLFPGIPRMPGRGPRGHPLGGHPETVPQEFKDQFHSAREDMSGSDDPCDSSDDDEDEDPNDIVEYDTEHSRFSTVQDRDRRCKRARHRVNHQARHERGHHSRGRPKKLNLPIFRDSSSNNAIMYDDWHSDINNLVHEGHSTTLIRDSILSALEGRPCCVAKTAMDDGDGSLRCVMTALDQVYGGATSYRQMMNKLNNMVQGNSELAKDYYERVLQVRVKLQEFHAYMFRAGNLEHHTKEAFFNGLRPEYRAMVVHKCDNPDITITQLLTAMRECEENEENNRCNRRAKYAKAYPPFMSRPTYGTDRGTHHPPLAPLAQGHYGCQEKGHVPIHTAHVKPATGAPAGDSYIPPYADYDNPDQVRDVEYEFYTDFYTATVKMANDAERCHDRCFNCKEPGHMWQNCPKPLKEEFKCIKERAEQQQEQLNRPGGPGAKEGCVPQQTQKPQVPAPALAAVMPQ